MCVATVHTPESAADVLRISQENEIYPRLFDPDATEETDPLVEHIGDVTRYHILNGGVPNIAEFAIDVACQNDRLIFKYVKSSNGEPWIMELTETVDVTEDADVSELIGEHRKRYDACINWDATGI